MEELLNEIVPEADLAVSNGQIHQNIEMSIIK